MIRQQGNNKPEAGTLRMVPPPLAVPPAAAIRSPTVISIVGTRAGNGATTFALHMAYALASDAQVLLIDLDEAGGSVAESLHIPHAQVAANSVENLYIGQSVGPERLGANTLRITDRHRRLRLVPGRSAAAEPGPGLHLILPRLATAIRAQDCDVVILDLGACLAYPGLTALGSVADAITGVSDRVIAVMSTDPMAVQHGIQVLRRVGRRLNPVDVVCWRWAPGWTAVTDTVWRENLPGMPIRAWLDWSDRRYSDWWRDGRPTFDIADAVRRHLGIRVART